MIENKGFDPQVIHDFKARIQASGRGYVMDEEDENTEEYVHFYFVGVYEGKEVVYDAVMYTLRLQHESEAMIQSKSRCLGTEFSNKSVSNTHGSLPPKRTDEIYTRNKLKCPGINRC